jgi:hypothetical protein
MAFFFEDHAMEHAYLRSCCVSSLSMDRLSFCTIGIIALLGNMKLHEGIDRLKVALLWAVPVMMALLLYVTFYFPEGYCRCSVGIMLVVRLVLVCAVIEFKRRLITNTPVESRGLLPLFFFLGPGVEALLLFPLCFRTDFSTSLFSQAIHIALVAKFNRAHCRLLSPPHFDKLMSFIGEEHWLADAVVRMISFSNEGFCVGVWSALQLIGFYVPVLALYWSELNIRRSFFGSVHGYRDPESFQRMFDARNRLLAIVFLPLFVLVRVSVG